MATIEAGGLESAMNAIPTVTAVTTSDGNGWRARTSETKAGGICAAFDFGRLGTRQVYGLAVSGLSNALAPLGFRDWPWRTGPDSRTVSSAMNDIPARIQKYYAGNPAKEWQRLAGADTGPIEFELTKRQIARRLDPNSRVLDIGGGPGRYTIWLASNGHRVTLADLVPELVEEGRRQIDAAGVQRNVEATVVADVSSLDRWEAATFDAALCLGPFYHLPDPEGREEAASELARVIRPGGWLFAGLMPRLGFLRRSIAVREEWKHLRDPAFIAALMDRGEFLNDNPGRFDAGFGARPEDIAPLFEGVGFRTEALVAAEGIAPVVAEELAQMAVEDLEAYAAALDLLEATAAEPSILGAANHLLYIGQRA
jgi:S-adenosylmethionine-dependent methyltransferase